MLKKIISILIITIFIFSSIYMTTSYADTITLDQIVETFNNSSSVREYASQGSEITAVKPEENKITITLTQGEDHISFDYTLDGTILTGTISGTESNVITGLIISEILIDSIGQLHGYEDGELFDTINSDEISNYTLENEGLETKKLEDGSYQIKVDISKKIPLVDFGDTYIEVADLQKLKDYIVGDGSAQKSKGNIILHKNGIGNNVTIFVGEKNELTENTYKSILSILEVMFESDKVSNYFKENYSNISEGDKELEGLKVEINPQKSDMEKVVLGEDDTYKFVRITIDKEVVNSKILGKEEQKKEEEEKQKEEAEKKEPTKQPDKTQNPNILPKAGMNAKIIAITILCVISLIIAIIKIHLYKDV